MLDEDDVVLTANGKPFAIIVRVDEGEIERTAAALRRARAQLAISRMRGTAAAEGLSGLSPRGIEAEIRAARAARR